ncbi:hypothetical protein K523DRAFT_72718 [Schizophyllum commune Tattone D]|nr:hypothetical protein K523DRAFT_72718 [Schizophyllum commune Tattone D]
MLLKLPFRRDPRPRGCRSRSQKSYLGGRPRCGVQPVRVASSFDPVAISNIDTDDTRGRRPADVEAPRWRPRLPFFLISHCHTPGNEQAF